MKILLIICLTLISIIVKADPTGTEIKWSIIPSGGIIFQNTTMADLNLGVGKSFIWGGIGLGHLSGRVGLEIGNEMDLDVKGVKVGAELNAVLFSLRLSGVNYTAGDESQFRLLPEIGLCLGSYLNIMYGYGIPFDNNRFDYVSSSRFGLSLNIPISTE